ncbi:MerR family transcriptional regulator [Desulfobulbus rhabdoformis]|uniref:MerR family transcriptional regulator n=1 Tax=Desulfobulbus rhabdoformis TaxID=34032 RepID=UPI00196601D6|nr:MerR family transcriptional regulator [Desulfobulbus rhabdoformis]MBM9613528.1 MerR family transcriptional regulator [Desulfobulbus rhabdoformis]
MARKKTEIQVIRSDVPIYPIGVAAKLVNVHPRTLRIYEQEGLIQPAMIGNRRMFSADDIQWITCLRTFIHEEGISIPGLKKLLEYIPCWEVADCPHDVCSQCSARVDRCVPKTLHRVGDEEARIEAKNSDVAKRKKAAIKKKHRSSG